MQSLKGKSSLVTANTSLDPPPSRKNVTVDLLASVRKPTCQKDLTTLSNMHEAMINVWWSD